MQISNSSESPQSRNLPTPVSILMPVYNESDIIEDVVREWHTDVCQFLPPGSELVFDDCSNDGTREILYKLQKEFPYLKVNESKKDGFFKSCLRLYGLAQCPLVFFTDSDGQYIPSEFWKIAEHIKDYDMVHGAKFNRHDPFYRVYSSKVFNVICRLIFGFPSSDINSAFRLIRKKVLDTTLKDIHLLTMLPNTELYVRAASQGYKIMNLDVGHRPRKYGVSRSLPLKVFFKEAYIAFRGILALKKELHESNELRANSSIK